MHLNDFSSDVFCINLPLREDRKQHMINQFKAFGIEATFVNGKRGTVERNKKLNAQRGCLNTHCKIIKEAEEAQLQNVCILEDDIWIHSKYEQKLETLKDLPKDWDLIYLGWTHVRDKTKYKKVKGDLYRIYEANDTNAYIINKHLYSLFDIIRKGPVPIDYALVEASLTYKMYCVLTEENRERIASQKHGRLYMGVFKQDAKTFGSNIAKNF